jgi:glycerol-3-phosphate dehydrogenase
MHGDGGIMDCDLLVIGGGINGTGIARDAAGRGLSVVLLESNDLACGTSSASTKLIHGGLRYLEHREFRLVREALQERTRLMRIAPHLIRPLRFVLPTPPGGRPRWLVRLGLLLYDHLAARGGLPRSGAVRLDGPLGAGLRAMPGGAFSYYDCWVDDARLVVLNAMDARERGADIRIGTRFLNAQRADDGWRVTAENVASAEIFEIHARAIVNAAGPWVERAESAIAGSPQGASVRLVKGSHIIVPRQFEGEHAYFMQNDDGRIMFAIPYEGMFTLIGTTDVDFAGDPGDVRISDAEIAYLCEEAERFLARPIVPADIVHTYSGVRPLFDDGGSDPASVTRDYVLRLDDGEGAPHLTVFGGKITTYRRLSEHALDMLARWFPGMGDAWTGQAKLPGGDLGEGGVEGATARLGRRFAFLDPATAERLVRAYGTRAERILGDARAIDDLGESFGHGFTEAELLYLMREEWAGTAEAVLWRRTKLGLHLDAGAQDRVARFMESRASKPNGLAFAAAPVRSGRGKESRE